MVRTMIGLSHVYERIARKEERTTGMTDASSKDAGAGGGGSLGSLVQMKVNICQQNSVGVTTGIAEFSDTQGHW